MEPARLLGLTLHPGLTEDVVRRAWRAQCLLAHPDKGGDGGRFQQLTAARDKLLEMIRKRLADPDSWQLELAAAELAAAIGSQHVPTAEEEQRQRQRQERHVQAALATLARQQERWPPHQGFYLWLGEGPGEGAEAGAGAGTGAGSVPVLHISSSTTTTTTTLQPPASSAGSAACQWRKVLTPTGHLLSSAAGREDHWGWCLPQALRALLQRFPSADGFALLCSQEGIRVLRHAGSTAQQSSELITPAELAAGGGVQAVVEAAADSLRPCPAAPRAEASPAAAPSTGSHPAPPVGITASSGLQPPAAAPTAGLGSTSGSFLLPAAQRAGSLLACFELVFSNEHLLQALGRRLTTGSLISLKLFQGALQGVGMHYGVPTPAGGWCEQGLQVLQAAYAAAASPAGGGCMGTSQQDNEPMQRTLYHLDKQCMQRALCQLADELVQQLLPQLARHPAGLPAQLVPDDGGSSNGGSRAGRGSGGGGGSTSIICCCRRFGATNSCQARHAPGVSENGLYVDGIHHTRSAEERSRDGYRCGHCAKLIPVHAWTGKAKRPAPALEATLALPSHRTQRARQLLTAFRQALASGSNPFYASMSAADGSERCPAGSCRSACAQAAACAYMDGLLALLGGGRNGSSSSSFGSFDSFDGSGGGGTIALPAVGPAAAEEYVCLVAALPQLAPSLAQCSRQTAACCGLGASRVFVRYLMSFNAQQAECCACFDAVYAPAARS